MKRSSHASGNLRMCFTTIGLPSIFSPAMIRFKELPKGSSPKIQIENGSAARSGGSFGHSTNRMKFRRKADLTSYSAGPVGGAALRLFWPSDQGVRQRSAHPSATGKRADVTGLGVLSGLRRALAFNGSM